MLRRWERLRTAQFTAFGLLMAGPAQSEMVSATCPWPLSARCLRAGPGAAPLQKAGPRLLMLTLALSSGCPKEAPEPGVSLASSCLPYLSPLSRYPLSHTPRTPSPPAALLKENQHILFFVSYLLGPAGTIPPHPTPYPEYLTQPACSGA